MPMSPESMCACLPALPHTSKHDPRALVRQKSPSSQSRTARAMPYSSIGHDTYIGALVLGRDEPMKVGHVGDGLLATEPLQRGGVQVRRSERSTLAIVSGRSSTLRAPDSHQSNHESGEAFERSCSAVPMFEHHQESVVDTTKVGHSTSSRYHDASTGTNQSQHHNRQPSVRLHRSVEQGELLVPCLGLRSSHDEHRRAISFPELLVHKVTLQSRRGMSRVMMMMMTMNAARTLRKVRCC